MRKELMKGRVIPVQESWKVMNIEGDYIIRPLGSNYLGISKKTNWFSGTALEPSMVVRCYVSFILGVILGHKKDHLKLTLCCQKYFRLRLYKVLPGMMVSMIVHVSLCVGVMQRVEALHDISVACLVLDLVVVCVWVLYFVLKLVFWVSLNA